MYLSLFRGNLHYTTNLFAWLVLVIGLTLNTLQQIAPRIMLGSLVVVAAFLLSNPIKEQAKDRHGLWRDGRWWKLLPPDPEDISSKVFMYISLIFYAELLRTAYTMCGWDGGCWPQAAVEQVDVEAAERAGEAEAEAPQNPEGIARLRQGPMSAAAAAARRGAAGWTQPRLPRSMRNLLNWMRSRWTQLPLPRPMRWMRNRGVPLAPQDRIIPEARGADGAVEGGPVNAA